MRITGGILARRNIKVPKNNVRPTTDMVREAMFSMIAHKIQDASFLDMFAGSGVVGFEAYSRGAREIYGIESSGTALKTLKFNLDTLKIENYHIISSDITTALKRGFNCKFDIIFADPPYWWEQEQIELKTGRINAGNCGEVPRLVKEGNCIMPDGLLIVERAARDLPAETDGWNIIDHRIYGGSSLTFYKLSTKNE